MGDYKPKHLVLQEFTRILHRENPMALNLEGNPHAENEYESEALSILSRFNEGAIHLCEDEQLQREIAVTFVNQAFQFWFGNPEFQLHEGLAFELLETYKAAYPKPEQPTTPEVLSEP